MVILLNGKNLEPSLPDLATASVMAVIAADMAGHPPLHERIECLPGGGLQHEVKMIRHETEAEYLKGKFPFRHGEQAEERGVVALLLEDDGTTVAATENMAGVPSDLTTRNPRYGNYGTEKGNQDAMEN